MIENNLISIILIYVISMDSWQVGIKIKSLRFPLLSRAICFAHYGMNSKLKSSLTSPKASPSNITKNKTLKQLQINS